MSSDPYQASGGPSDPGSWNRYAYVGGDPLNRVDPTGKAWCLDYLRSCDPACESGICEDGPNGGGGGGGGGEGNFCGADSFFSPGTACFTLITTVPTIEGMGNDKKATGCEAQLTARIDGFLMGKGSPLAGLGSTFVGNAKSAGVNPYLLVAISGAESSFGTSGSSRRTSNAFGLMTRKGEDYVLKNFNGDWSAGIAQVSRTVDNMFIKGNITVSLLYSGKGGAYCVDTPAFPCSNGARNVASIFSELGGGDPENPVDLLWPCKD